jgi:2-dehydropantoate 2-reductase
MEPLYVVGAGGIGCAVGHALCTAGVPVWFVEANADKIRSGNSRGVVVAGRNPQPARFIHFDEWNPSPEAVVLLCTKCYDNASVLPRLPESVTLIPIQNGFDSALEERGHCWEGIASFVAACDPQRPETRITRRGRLHLGQRHGTRSTDSPEWFQSLKAVAPFRVELVSDILPYKYTKLMYNAAISPLAAALGLDNGQLLWIRPARRLFFDLLRENYAILRSAGVTLGKIGPFHPDTVNQILQRATMANVLAWAFHPSLRDSYCSMAGDLPGGPTEIDYYNGRLIALANGRPCPLNRRVHTVIKNMERERQTPGLYMLAEFLHLEEPVAG